MGKEPKEKEMTGKIKLECKVCGREMPELGWQMQPICWSCLAKELWRRINERVEEEDD
jgi:hypothetical protein